MRYLNIRGLLGVSLSTIVLAGVIVVPAQAKTPNDTFYGQQWYLPQLGAERAWDRTTGSASVIVAVVDTTMDVDHEDLKQNIWRNEDEIFGNGIDDDLNGFVDDVNGWNFVTDSNNVRPGLETDGELGYIHATLVASLIAARGDNGIGIAGVAWGVRIMPVVALDTDGNGSTADVARAIRYAADNGAQIINLSLEGYGDIPDVDAALAYAHNKNVLTVAAAGNAEEAEGIDLDQGISVYPACLSKDLVSGVVGVGSTGQDDRKALYANYGSCIQLSAPGADIFGARPSVEGSAGYEGGFSGTSLATPLVSGTAALLKSLRPDWGGVELREWLAANTTPIDHLQDPAFRFRLGRGRLDIGAAIQNVPGGVVPEASSSPASSDMRAVTAADILMKGLASGRGIRVAVGDGFVVADTAGGRAWGVAANGTVTPFFPYGTAYRAGLDVVAVPGGAAFAPRGGGGHVVVMDVAGVRLASLFPFGKEVRGRWDVAVLPATGDDPAELVMSGPFGSKAVLLSHIHADGWRDISLAELERRSGR
jgi:subtilisin family serine protease